MSGAKPSSFRTLLPATQSQSEREQEKGPQVKAENIGASPKKRVNITKVACHKCRSKKVACDGKRPTCTYCETRSLVCKYDSIDESETRTMALKRTNDVLRDTVSSYEGLVHSLRSLPEEEANLLFKRLRTAADPKSVLTSLATVEKDGGSDGKVFDDEHGEMEDVSNSTRSQGRFSSPLDMGTDEELQLLKRHPNAYPTIGQSKESLMAKVIYDKHLKVPELSENSIHPGLNGLNIRAWTSSLISNENAAETISLFLRQEHPILGLFNENDFIKDLVSEKTTHCSRFLVSSLLAFALQGCTALDPSAFARSYEFETEARGIWEEGEEVDNPNTIAALVILYQAIGSHGKNQAATEYLVAVENMCKRMRLFGVEDSMTEEEFSDMAPEKRDSFARAAWGAFDVLSTNSIFNVMMATCFPPKIPIPGPPISKQSADGINGVASKQRLDRYSTSTSVGLVFPEWCRLWQVIAEVMYVYRASTDAPLSPAPLSFALSRHQKLMTIADQLPHEVQRNVECTPSVLMFHIWFHCSIIDIFRPFITIEDAHISLGTASKMNLGLPEIITAASIQQLQHLILTYLTRFQFSSRSTIFWHAGLMYVANDMLRSRPIATFIQEGSTEDHGSETDGDYAASSATSNSMSSNHASPKPAFYNSSWHFWFTLCIRSYARLSTCFQVCESMVQGLLAMALEKGAIDNKEAMLLMQELSDFTEKRQVGARESTIKNEDIVRDKNASGSFILDLDLAIRDGKAARVDRLVERFEQMTIFEEFTTGIL